MSVVDRLKELGIELPQARAMAIYRPSVMAGNLVYISGQIAMKDGQVVNPGRLGDNLTVEQGQEAARVAAINALAACRNAHGRMDALRVLRMVGYVACTPDFTEHSKVIDAASELIRDVLGESYGVGTRLAIGVQSLPAGSPVEIEMQLEIR
jgi:enamine deaminase RidA (YjgF/YER057c/UK114 family)